MRRKRSSRPLRSKTIQTRTVRPEPSLGPVRVRADAVDEGPESWRVVEVDEMRDLMRGEIVEHVRRGEDEAPGEAQAPGRRARPPAADRVAHRDVFRLHPDCARMASDRRLDVLARLAFE